MQTKKVNRNRKDKNLAGLYAVSSDVAYKNGKLRPEIYGVVDKKTPYIFKTSAKNGKARTFVRDSTDLPKACKNRILAFWDDKVNKNKQCCYLAEKPLYEQNVKKK